MAYVSPSTRSDGFIVTSSVWNQDVVDNVLATYGLLDVAPSIVYESNDDNYSITSSWTVRRLNGTFSDPNGIILNEDYVNYQFDLADGTYLTEIWTQFKTLNPSTELQWSRLRDVDNNETITGLSNTYGHAGSGGSTHAMVIQYTYNEFILANGSNTTLQLQSYSVSGDVLQKGILASTYSEDNTKGAYQTVMKFWRIE